MIRAHRPRAGLDLDRAAWLGVAAASVVAVALGLYHVGARSFWLDEATSIVIARQNPRDLVHTLMNGEANSSLYYVVLSVWRQLGEGEIRLRSLSVVFGLATVPLVYLIGRRTVGSAAAAGACLLLACQPLVIPYMQEVRGYTLAMLLSTATVLLWLIALETDRARWWVGFAIVAGLSVYAHLFCGFVIAALVAIAVVQGAPWTRRMAIALTTVALIALPFLWFLAAGDDGQVSWIPALSAERVGEVAAALAGGSVALLVVIAVGVALAFVRPVDDVGSGRATLLAWLVVPIVAGVVISVWKPLLVPRYLIVVIPPVTLLASAGFLRLRPRALGYAALGLAVALTIGPLQRHYEGVGEDWRSAAGWVAAVAKPGDRIAYQVPGSRKPFGWYLETIPGESPTETSLDAIRASPGRLWLVLYRMDLAAHQALLATLPDLKVDQSKAFDGLRVQLLVPAR